MHSMTDTESAAWQSFVLVTQNFLINRKAENYQELVEDMLSKFKDLGMKMRIKFHYLFNHLDRLPAKPGDLSEEHREMFHQDIKVMEEKFQGGWDAHKMADNCWSL